MDVLISQVQINWYAIVLAAFVHMALGFAWYGSLFGAQWMKEQGLTPESMKGQGMTAGMTLAAFLAALLMNFVLRYAVAYAGAMDIMGGAVTGFAVWLGFIATVMLNGVLYEKKSWQLYWINSGYYLVSLVIAGAILAAWV